MNYFNIGNFVTRKSYNEDVLFEIIEYKDNMYILKGINSRIYADANEEDLKIVEDTSRYFSIIDNRAANISKSFRKMKANFREYNPGKILHIDGDERYAKKTLEYYKKNGLPCSVYSIEERKQPKYIRNLVINEKPNIVVITGHDCLYKNRNAKEINNYRNSKYFADSVREVRRISPNKNEIAIFAGACQSYYEYLINVGANFASSPGRVLIDFFDPLIVAQTLSITDENMIVTINSMVDKFKEGYRTINGVPTRGKSRFVSF